MKKTRLSVLNLENRLTPSATLSFLNGNLTLRGDNLPNTFAITKTSATTVNATVNGKNMGNYAVTGNLSVFGGNSSDNVTFNVGGFTHSGNVTVSGGNNSATNPDVVLLTNGKINGSVSVTTGNGNDSVSLIGVTVGGVANTFNGGFGADTLTIGGVDGGGAVVAGLVIANGFNSVNIIDSTVGQLVYNSSSEGIATALFMNVNSVVPGSVTYIGGSAGDTANLNGIIAGNLTYVGGAGNNTLLANATSSVNGSVNFVASSGNDVATLNGQIAGSGSFNLGNGNNTVTDSPTSGIFGDFTVNTGGGSDAVTTSGLVGGRTNLSLGHGTNTFDLSGTPASDVTYNGGGGTDGVTVNSAQVPGNLRVYLGAGADTFTYGPNVFVGGSALLDFGVDTDTDMYVQGQPVIAFNQTIINYP